MPEQISWTKKNLAIKITGPHVVECLETHGWHETLHQTVLLATRGSHGEGDQYLEEMLTVLPTLCVLRDFLKKIPTYEVSAEDFEALIKTGQFV